MYKKEIQFTYYSTMPIALRWYYLDFSLILRKKKQINYSLGTNNNERNRAAECELRSTVLHRRGGLHVGERDIDLHVADGEVSSFAVDGSLEPVLVHFVDKCDHVIFLEKKIKQV